MSVTSGGRTVLFCAVAYGALVLIVAGPMYLFSFQADQSLLSRVAGGAYTLTLFPAALVGFSSRKLGGLWMIVVSPIALIALWQGEIVRYHAGDGLFALLLGLAWWALIAAIPGILGTLLLKSRKA